ncbi:hypothetical protein [Haloarcula salinisoli]|uniref:hypothetical protein n=1 Tax=Haloarcula salinisoli TaxID=2487746 RepID=UPI001F2BFE25|nr:hypothetical protein [Halomicroarcula salinisoli]
MSLQIGPVLRSAGAQLLSRTGAILLAAYIALTAALLPLSNTMLVRIYERVGLTEPAEVIPLVLDVPLSVAVGGYLLGVLVGSYLSVVAVRTFVAGDGGQFPSGAFTRNVPLAIANVVVGGLVYGLAVAVGSLLLVVPGLLAYIAFLFMLPYVAVEDRNFVDALRSSYRLSKGNWLMLGVLLLVVVGVSGGLAPSAGWSRDCSCRPHSDSSRSPPSSRRPRCFPLPLSPRRSTSSAGRATTGPGRPRLARRPRRQPNRRSAGP